MPFPSRFILFKYTLGWFDIKCVFLPQRGKALKGGAAFNYVMKPGATGALILEATGTELIQFSPFNILNGAAQMEAKYVV